MAKRRLLTTAQLRAIFAKQGMRPSASKVKKIRQDMKDLQIGNTTIPVDVKLRAKKPGFRGTYYEYRANRSDVSPKERL